MEESNEIKTLRNMEWERAKGSINAVLASIWDMENDKYCDLETIVDEFIENFSERISCL